MPSLKIHLLGSMHVLWENQPLPPFPTHNTRSLFAYLVTHRQRAHPRSRLAGLFWCDFPEARAQRNLNNTLWRLRHTLPEDYFVVADDTIAFNTASDYWLDVAEFERQVAEKDNSPSARQRLQAAITLYRGDFLEGWYEDWALVEAERLRLLYIHGLQDLGNWYRTQGEFVQALDCARRSLAVDPLREEIHYRVMELYAALGQREAALTQFATCQRVLKNELGILPSAETIRLCEQIRAGTQARVPAAQGESHPVQSLEQNGFSTSRTPFDEFGQVELVGREKELAYLRTRLESACGGRGCMLLLEGEAGIGKTRVANETAKLASALGFATLWGACSDLQSPPPYQGLMPILRGGIGRWKRGKPPQIPAIWLNELLLLLPELAAEFPNLAPRAESSSQERLLEAIAQYVIGIGRASPHLIVLEDLHWADPATLEALRFLAPRLGDLPILLILTLRPEEVAAREDLARAVTALKTAGVTERLELQRLSPEHSARLASRVLGLDGDQPGLARFIYRETEGNPFFIGEVLRASVEEGYFRLRADGRWEIPRDREPAGQDGISFSLPRGIRGAVQRRLASLAPVSRAVLDVAAVLGDGFDFNLLEQACGEGEETTLAATDDLLRRQLLLEQGDRLEFSHDQIRHVVYQGLSRARRRWLHRQAGHALARIASQQIVELANHFYIGQDYANALRYCLQAGTQARAMYANQSALTYLGWAVESARHIEGDEGTRGLMLAYEQRAQVWDHVGNDGEALADFESLRQTAAAHNDLSGVARALRQSGWIRGDHFGEWQRGLNQVQRAWETARESGDAHEAAAALRDIGALHNMQCQYHPALDAHRAALAAFRELGDLHGEASSLQYLAVTYHFLGEYEQSLDAYQQALTLWEKLGERRTAAKTQTNIGYLSITTGDLTRADESFQQALVTLREIEAKPAVEWALIGLGAVHRYRCQCRESLAALAEAAEIDEGAGKNPYNLGLIRHHRGVTLWHRGDAGAAFAEQIQALDLARQSETPTLTVGVLVDLGRCYRQQGNFEKALALHQEAIALARQAPFPAGELNALTELGLDKVMAGQRAEGLTELESACTRAQALHKRRRPEFLLNLAEGYLSAERFHDARQVAQECVAQTDVQRLNEWAARGWWVLGSALFALGNRAKAETALSRGLDCLAAAGDSPTQLLLRAAVEQVRCLPSGCVSVRLARTGAATRRSLRDDEFVRVTWTVDAGAADAALLEREGKAAQRRVRILRLLQEAAAQDGEPTQEDLATALRVTVRTVRSDLGALRRNGHSIRTRGQ